MKTLIAKPALASHALLAAVFLSGCVSFKQAQTVAITHGPLPKAQTQDRGAIQVRRFSDGRKSEDKPYVGEMRGPAYTPTGRFFVIKDGGNLSELLTASFSDALKAAGYRVSALPDEGTTPQPADAVLEGEIKKFWLTPAWNTRQEISIQLRLRTKDGKDLLWEKEVEGQHGKFVGYPNAPEYEEVIQKALDKTLAQAVKEFSTDEFQGKVKAINQ